MASNTKNNIPSLAGLEIDVTIIQGRNLVAKDRNIVRKKSTSDPYVKLLCCGKLWGQTKTAKKTLSPTWNESFKIHLGADVADDIVHRGNEKMGMLYFQLFDEDKMSDDDPMGTVVVPLPVKTPPQSNWYPVGKGVGSNFCKNATGELEIKIAVSARRMLSMVKGNSWPIQCGSIRVGLGWEMEAGRAIDLDTSCVAVDSRGNVLMDETVYYGDLVNSNGSIRHTGDEREGDENLQGSGDDEVITCDLDHVPGRVLALYFILTMATSGKTLADVKSALVRVTDTRSGMGICQFIPSIVGEHTALFLMRISRNASQGGWVLSIIEDTDHTARDFGSLIPEIKGYSRDIVPDIKIDPNERIAVMRKGGTIRLQDYTATRGAVPDKVALGLTWDVTNGVNIDLDASAICLDASLNVVDIVFFRQLHSKDGAIHHGGDEREGDAHGDDETITVDLMRLNPSVAYIGFVVNSFSGQELDDVSKASCHLYDVSSRKDMARYTLSNCKELDKHTALVMCCLYRDVGSGMWFLRIISEAAHGRVAGDLVDELESFLKRSPPQPPTIPPEPEIVVNQMPEPVPMDEEIIVDPMVPLY